MSRAKYTLEQRQEAARERKERARAARELQELIERDRFEKRVERYRRAIGRERALMQAHISALKSELGEKTWKFASPAPGPRAIVRNYRLSNEWSVLKMAKWCCCTSKQIRLIESEDRSIMMREDTWHKILRAVNYEPEMGPRPAADREQLDGRARAEAERRSGPPTVNKVCPKCGRVMHVGSDWCPCSEPAAPALAPRESESVVPETRAPEACPADGETDHGVEKHDDPEEDEWLTF